VRFVRLLQGSPGNIRSLHLGFAAALIHIKIKTLRLSLSEEEFQATTTEYWSANIMHKTEPVKQSKKLSVQSSIAVCDHDPREG